MNETKTCWEDWKSREESLLEAVEGFQKTKEEEEYLRYSLAEIEAISPTDLVSIPNPSTIADTMMIAISAEGIALVSLGNIQMINIVSATKPSMV